MGFFVEIFRSQTLYYQFMYITEPEFVHAVNLLNPSPSDTLMLFIPYCNLLDKESLMAPVSTSCSKMSPDVDPDAIISSLFTQPMEVTAPAWPLSFLIGYFYLLVFISQTLTVLLTDPAAIYLDLGENKHELIEEGSYWPE